MIVKARFYIPSVPSSSDKQPAEVDSYVTKGWDNTHSSNALHISRFGRIEFPVYTDDTVIWLG